MNRTCNLKVVRFINHFIIIRFLCVLYFPNQSHENVYLFYLIETLFAFYVWILIYPILSLKTIWNFDWNSTLHLQTNYNIELYLSNIECYNPKTLYIAHLFKPLIFLNMFDNFLCGVFKVLLYLFLNI